MAQVFAYPAAISAKQMPAETGRDPGPPSLRDPQRPAGSGMGRDVERSTMSIAGRAVASLIQSQGIGDLYRIYATTQRDGVDFNLAFIPSTFDAPHKEEFDNAYMRALYDVGYDMAAEGLPWQKTPPGFVPVTNAVPAD